MFNSLQGASAQDLGVLVALVALAVAGLLRFKGWLVLPNDPKAGKRPAPPPPPDALRYFDRLQTQAVPPSPEPPSRLPEPRAASTLVEDKRSADAAINKRISQLRSEIETLEQAAGTKTG